jgi:hypothetical protein
MESQSAKRDMSQILQAMMELANMAITERGYEFPFVVIVVTGNRSVSAVECVKAGEHAISLCEYYPEGDELTFPLNFFLSCKGKEPIAAVLNQHCEIPSWIN